MELSVILYPFATMTLLAFVNVDSTRTY